MIFFGKLPRATGKGLSGVQGLHAPYETRDGIGVTRVLVARRLCRVQGWLFACVLADVERLSSDRV